MVQRLEGSWHDLSPEQMEAMTTQGEKFVNAQYYCRPGAHIFFVSFLLEPGKTSPPSAVCETHDTTGTLQGGYG